jgi:hypothetical protein
VLSDKKIGQPDGVAWIEYGSIDTTGHKEGWKLAKRLPDELNGLGEIITKLNILYYTDAREALLKAMVE